MDGLSLGSMVHYVMPNGMHRPAIVVEISDQVAGTVNLQVFTDGANDQMTGADVFNELVSRGILWRTSVEYAEVADVNTWHWPEVL